MGRYDRECEEEREARNNELKRLRVAGNGNLEDEVD